MAQDIAVKSTATLVEPCKMRWQAGDTIVSPKGERMRIDAIGVDPADTGTYTAGPDAQRQVRFSARLKRRYGWRLDLEAVTEPPRPMPLPDQLKVGDVVLWQKDFEKGRRRLWTIQQIQDGSYYVESPYRFTSYGIREYLLVGGPSYAAGRLKLDQGAKTSGAAPTISVERLVGEIQEVNASSGSEPSIRVGDGASGPERAADLGNVTFWKNSCSSSSVKATKGPPVPKPRPGQTWRGLDGLTFTITDETGPNEGTVREFLARSETGERVRRTFAGSWSCEFISGPTEPESYQERRARELKLDLEWHCPEGVSRDAYTRRYARVHETVSAKLLTVPADEVVKNHVALFKLREHARKAAASEEGYRWWWEIAGVRS